MRSAGDDASHSISTYCYHNMLSCAEIDKYMFAGGDGFAGHEKDMPVDRSMLEAQSTGG